VFFFFLTFILSRLGNSVAIPKFLLLEDAKLCFHLRKIS